MSWSRMTYKGKDTKLEIFTKRDKLFKSLPVHRKALEAGLHVPEIYGVENQGGSIYKYTQWIPGNSIYDEMSADPGMIEPICKDLAKYINELYDVEGISPVDNHFKNFVWYNNSVIYIDMKKLLCRDYENHIVQMAKLCIKSCRADRRKTIAFLKEYAKHRDVTPIIGYCNNRNWKWFSLRMKSIKLEEIDGQKTT